MVLRLCLLPSILLLICITSETRADTRFRAISSPSWLSVLWYSALCLLHSCSILLLITSETRADTRFRAASFPSWLSAVSALELQPRYGPPLFAFFIPLPSSYFLSPRRQEQTPGSVLFLSLPFLSATFLAVGPLGRAFKLAESESQKPKTSRIFCRKEEAVS